MYFFGGKLNAICKSMLYDKDHMFPFSQIWVELAKICVLNTQIWVDLTIIKVSKQTWKLRI